MISCKLYKNIDDIETIWDSLVSRNPKLLPYMYYYYNKCICDSYWLYQLKGFQRPLFAVCYKDNTPIFIAPLAKSITGRFCKMLGDIQGSDNIDFIYASDIDREILGQCIESVRKTVGGEISCSRINADSLVLDYIRNIAPGHRIEPYPHVNVKFGDDFNEYFKGLSKNSRQNIRTSLNRIVKDGTTVEFKVAHTENEIAKVLDLYYSRMRNRYRIGMSAARIRLMEYIGRHFKHDTRSLTTSDNRFICYLEINGEMASCMLGLKNRQETLITVPRLSINDKFSKYSPGNLLIYECVKYLIDHTSIRNLDLSRGNEKYKYIMGGVEYYTYTFDIKQV